MATVKTKKSKSKAKPKTKKKTKKKTLKDDIVEEIDKIDSLINDIVPITEVLQTIREALTADKPISCNVIFEDGMKDANSMTKDFVDVPDWSNRLKAADMGARLHNLYPAEKRDMKLQGELKILWEGNS